jgi:hypothetical protein
MQTNTWAGTPKQTCKPLKFSSTSFLIFSNSCGEFLFSPYGHSFGLRTEDAGQGVSIKAKQVKE